MRIFFHGTTADRVEAILKEGIRPDVRKIWNYKDNHERAKCVYVTPREDDAVQLALWGAARRWKDTGSCGAVGFDGVLRLVVFHIEIPDDVKLVPDEHPTHGYRLAGSIPPTWILGYSTYSNLPFQAAFPLLYQRFIEVRKREHCLGA